MERNKTFRFKIGKKKFNLATKYDTKSAQNCILNDWYTCAKNNGVVFPRVI